MVKTGAVVAVGCFPRTEEFIPLLPYEDTTVIRSMVNRLRELGLDPVAVVAGDRAEELEEHLFDAGVRFLKNERYQESQLLDFYGIGIEAIGGECGRLLLIPANKPAIRQQTIRRLLEIHADLVQPAVEGEPGDPILIRSRMARQLCRQSHRCGIREAAERSGMAAACLQVRDRGTVWSVDTLEDYRSLLSWKNTHGRGVSVFPTVKLRLEAEKPFFGPGVVELMEDIRQTGSIQEACQRMALSYSKGSRMIKRTEQQMGIRILERRSGGFGGGGSQLTEEGILLLNSYRQLLRQVEEQTQDLFWGYFPEELQRKKTEEE